MSFVAPALDYLVRTFHPGYFDSPQPDTLPKGGTPDAKNCLFGSLQLQGSFIPGETPQQHIRATLLKRSGSRLLTTAAVVAGHGFDGLFEFRKVGQISGRLVGVVNGAVYYWDNISSFVQIGATAPFAAGTKVQFFVYRNLLFIGDGLTSRVWDGVLGNDLFTPGQIAPTAAPGLALVAGPGVTGTYEGYALWYDSTHDHEVSPSAISVQVAAVNQQRQWTKPAGAPAANYDKWRVYCRRVDTNEVYYKRVAEVAVGTATVTEATTDAARNLNTLGPLPFQNDPPPANLLIQAEFQGYRIGFVDADDQAYVSRLGDPQSQHPKDVLGIARGTGGEVRSIKKFGIDIVLQKASRTYRLKGDRMPFIPDEIHSTFGNVGPTSAVEIRGKYYAWDEDKGPYWTDLQANWVPIATGRIATTVKNVPKTQAKFIECVHYKPLDLVLWAVPQGASNRRRTILSFHTELESWLPPITGLEFASLSTFIDTTGSLNLYVGDYWGRLFQLLVDNVEGVPSGSLLARVSASTAATVTCDNELAVGVGGVLTVGGACAFYTTGGGLMGLPVLHIDANGNRQWRRIQANTATQLTLDTTNDAAWNNLPVAGDTIVVGGLDWYWRSAVVDFGDPFTKKVGRYFQIQATPGSAAMRITLQLLLEGLKTRAYLKNFALAAASAWGAGLWGSMVWGGGDPDRQKMRIGRTFFGAAVEVSNPYPNQPVEILSLRITADPLRARKVKSGGV